MRTQVSYVGASSLSENHTDQPSVKFDEEINLNLLQSICFADANIGSGNVGNWNAPSADQGEILCSQRLL